MVLQFTKMNGAGNDFVLVDNRNRQVQLTRDQVARLCDRHRGIGADGLLMVVPSTSANADWAWEFYNSDGGTAEMCGNGARCFARFVQRLTGSPDRIRIQTAAGIVQARFDGDRVTVTLTEPRDLRLAQKLDLSGGTEILHSLNTGVPHAVVFVPDATEVQVDPIGAEIRYHQQFAPKGTNVNFVQLLGPNFIRVRTYERGVEAETLACGTGVTAAALISARVNGFLSPIQVEVRGGDTLEVRFKDEGGRFTDVELTGPADFVFTGEVQV